MKREIGQAAMNENQQMETQEKQKNSAEKCSISEGNKLNPQGHYRYGTNGIAASYRVMACGYSYYRLSKIVFNA